MLTMYSLQGYALILNFLQSYPFSTSKLALFMSSKMARILQRYAFNYCKDMVLVTSLI
jgi:hypothetical protein